MLGAYFDSNFFVNTDVFRLNRPLVEDFVNLINVKTDVLAMIDMFPDYSDELEFFDFTALDSYSATYEVLSTPDFKIYYPEPFIASPSFVHEDL